MGGWGWGEGGEKEKEDGYIIMSMGQEVSNVMLTDDNSYAVAILCISSTMGSVTNCWSLPQIPPYPALVTLSVSLITLTRRLNLLVTITCLHISS